MPKRSINSHITALKAAGGFFITPYYSPADIEKIVETAGGIPRPSSLVEYRRFTAGSGEPEKMKINRRKALERWLNEAALVYRHADFVAREPTPRGLAAIYAKIERAADKFVLALRLDDDGTLPPALRSDGFLEMARLETANGGRSGPKSTRSNADRVSQHRASVGLLHGSLDGIKRFKKWAGALKEKYEAIAQTQKKSGRSPRGHKADEPLHDLIATLRQIYFNIFERSPAASIYNGTVGGPYIRYLQACLAPLGIQKTPEALRALHRATASRASSPPI